MTSQAESPTSVTTHGTAQDIASPTISFNSNGLGAGNSFTTVSAAPNIDFDFSNYIYSIEGTLFRDQAVQFADLGAVQIYESAGTLCP